MLISMTDGWDISCKIALRWMPLDLTDDKSTLVQVMAWCRQVTSHYLSQWWPRSLSPYGVTRPQWVNSLLTGTSIKFVNDLCPWILQCQSVMMVWWLIAVSVLDSLWLCDAIWQQIYININLGNGLLSDGIKPSPESMLTYHQRCFVTFTWEQFH